MTTEFATFCPRCMFGKCTERKITYVGLYKGRILTAPDTPARVCDVCGYREFDEFAIEHLYKLTGRIASTPEELAPPAKSSPVDFDLLEAKKPPQPKP